MENNLPHDDYRPQDEYPALDANPVEAAEPVEAAPVDVPEQTAATEQPESAPDVPPSNIPAPPTPAQQQYPQNTVPYYTYPVYPPIPGMPLHPQQQQFPQHQQYPQQQYPQQPVQPQYPQPQYPQPSYQQYPFQYPDYTQYYGSYQQQPTQQPVQQPQFTQPNAPAGQPAAPTAPPQGMPVAYHTPAKTDPVPDEKKSTSTGTKAFLIILTALMLSMIAGFIVYVVNASNKDVADSKSNSNPYAALFDENNNGIFEIPDTLDTAQPKTTETEEEITLVADDGATQKRDNDNPDSIGKPDKTAKGIELSPQPADADSSSKYTAKSSFNTLVDSVVTITCYEKKVSDNPEDAVSGGSGTIISADGYIITNAHVLNDSKQFAVNVTLNNGKKYQAVIIGYDTWTDIAVLKIDATGLKPAAFGDSELVEVGDDVITIGSPGGTKFKNTLTQGVVSALDREISTSKCVRYIQSDAAINPGSSGGPLCNLYGQVIGITTAKTVAANFENMSFSIPSASVKDVVSDLIHYGYIPDRARIGFAGSEIPAEFGMIYEIPTGVVVEEIAEDGALKDSDVKRGDIITAIDGTKITSFQDIYNILAKHKTGDKIKLSICRLDDPSLLLDDDE